MTGYGVGDAPLGGGRVLVEMRAVNHRFLDVRARLPTELADHAGAVEDAARKCLERGRVELVARIEGDALAVPVLAMERARAAFRQLVALRDELQPGEHVPLSLLGSVPDLFSAHSLPEGDLTRDALCSATERACIALRHMRVKEGLALREDLARRLDQVRTHVEALRLRCGDVVATYRRKLRERIDQLLRGAEVRLDPARIEHEVALFADRADIAEEITRLLSHTVQFVELLDDDGSIGRRLEFLLQEMTREANTIGAKSSDVPSSHIVVELKADLERMREQVQNVM